MEKRSIAVGLAVVLFVLGTMMGCGGKGKYLGRYLCEQSGSVLELKTDGTYSYETTGFFGGVSTGEWSVEKADGHEIVSLLGAKLGEPSAFERSRKTGNLITIFGQTFVKQN